MLYQHLLTELNLNFLFLENIIVERSVTRIRTCESAICTDSLFICKGKFSFLHLHRVFVNSEFESIIRSNTQLHIILNIRFKYKKRLRRLGRVGKIVSLCALCHKTFTALGSIIKNYVNAVHVNSMPLRLSRPATSR